MEKLERLLKGTNLRRLSVRGIAITDDDLKQFDGPRRLTEIELFGTKVTDDGAARLAKMYPGVKINLRSNAVLGVAGHSDSAGCRITVVQDGSAADRAGLKADDIIVRFQDHAIADFESLTSQVGACQPGDKVTLELRRGNELLKKEIELSAWK